MTQNEENALKLENQLCFPLYATSRKVISLYAPYLKTLGITYTQYIVFMALWEKDGVSISELGKRLYLDNGTLTPLLKKMENKGYLTRTRSKDDERIVLINLTKNGKNMKEKCKSFPFSVGNFMKLEKEKAKTLYILLYEILESLQ